MIWYQYYSTRGYISERPLELCAFYKFWHRVFPYYGFHFALFHLLHAACGKFVTFNFQDEHSLELDVYQRQVAQFHGFMGSMYPEMPPFERPVAAADGGGVRGSHGGAGSTRGRRHLLLPSALGLALLSLFVCAWLVRRKRRRSAGTAIGSRLPAPVPRSAS